MLNGGSFCHGVREAVLNNDDSLNVGLFIGVRSFSEINFINRTAQNTLISKLRIFVSFPF